MKNTDSTTTQQDSVEQMLVKYLAEPTIKQNEDPYFGGKAIATDITIKY